MQFDAGLMGLMAGSGAEVGSMLTWGMQLYSPSESGGMFIPMADVDDEDEEVDVVGLPEEQYKERTVKDGPSQFVHQPRDDFLEVLVLGRPDYCDQEVLKHIDYYGSVDEEIDPLSMPELPCKNETKIEYDQETTESDMKGGCRSTQRKELGHTTVHTADERMQVTCGSTQGSPESSIEHSTEPLIDLSLQPSAEPPVGLSSEPSVEPSVGTTASNYVQVKNRRSVPATQEKKKRFPCTICGRIYAKAVSLERHQAVHQPPELQCSMCDRKFIKSCALKRHERFHQMSLTRCQLCGKQLSTANNKTLLNHLRTHMGQQRHRCFDCGRTFDLTTALLRHRRTEHGEQMDECVTIV